MRVKPTRKPVEEESEDDYKNEEEQPVEEDYKDEEDQPVEEGEEWAVEGAGVKQVDGYEEEPIKEEMEECAVEGEAEEEELPLESEEEEPVVEAEPVGGEEKVLAKPSKFEKKGEVAKPSKFENSEKQGEEEKTVDEVKPVKVTAGRWVMGGDGRSPRWMPPQPLHAPPGHLRFPCSGKLQDRSYRRSAGGPLGIPSGGSLPGDGGCPDTWKIKLLLSAQIETTTLIKYVTAGLMLCLWWVGVDALRILVSLATHIAERAGDSLGTESAPLTETLPLKKHRFS